MAYVRVTKSMVENIESRVDKMCVAELEASNAAAVNEFSNAIISQEAEGAAWGAYHHLASAMPVDWLSSCNRFTLEFMEKNDEGRYRRKCSFYQDLPQANEFKVPPRMSNWHPDIKVKIEEIKEGTFIAAAYKAMNKVEEIKEKWYTVKVQLRQFIQSHTSLNTALKEMPELAMYIDQGYIDKVNETVTRKKRAKTSSDDTDGEGMNIDVEAIVSAAVAHRIAHGGV